jgi:hypothetical protein
MRHGARKALPLAVGAVLLSACGSTESSTDTDGSTDADGTAPDGKTPTETPSYGRPTPCESSEECEEGQSCIAPYDPGAGGKGDSVCVEGCIEQENDLSQWCVDDDACCGDLRCHEVDGFCEPPVDDGSTDTGSSTSTDTTSATNSTTGATDTGTTGSGSTGTSTGTDTGTGSQGTTSTTTSP